MYGTLKEAKLLAYACPCRPIRIIEFADSVWDPSTKSLPGFAYQSSTERRPPNTMLSIKHTIKIPEIGKTLQTMTTRGEPNYVATNKGLYHTSFLPWTNWDLRGQTNIKLPNPKQYTLVSTLILTFRGIHTSFLVKSIGSATSPELQFKANVCVYMYDYDK